MVITLDRLRDHARPEAVAARVQTYLARHQDDPKVAADIQRSYADIVAGRVAVWSEVLR